MTVPQQPTRTTHVGNGVTTIFAYDFLCVAKRDLQVIVAGTIVDQSAYSVSNIGQSSGGDVTFIAAPADQARIVIQLDMVLDRETDYQTNGDLFSKTLNLDFDRVWLAIQQAFGSLSRVPRLGDADIDGQGAYRANGNRIQDLGDPVQGQDGVNLRTMLTAIAEFSSDGAGQAILDLLALPDGATRIGYGSGTVATALEKFLDAVIDYGIDNTGASNVATALQAAINDAATKKRALHIPEGIYLLGGSRIRIPSNSVIYGDGYTRTILRRTVDSAQGTVECYGAHDVVLKDMGIEYTPTTFTMGYSQTGWCARNGSYNINFEGLGVTGKINRQIHVINSYSVRLMRCTAIGGGDAGIRVCCDMNASSYADFTDETSPSPVTYIWLDGCYVTGSTGLLNTTRAGTFYGIIVNPENGVDDRCDDVTISNSVVRYTDAHGISLAGKCRNGRISNCVAANVGDLVSTGVGFFLQKYSTDVVQRAAFVGCVAISCTNGFYFVDALYSKIVGCSTTSCKPWGVRINGGVGNLVQGTTAESGGVSTFGIIVQGAALDCVVDGCNSNANGAGIKLAGTTSYCAVTNNTVGGNSTGIDADNTTSKCMVDGNVSRLNTVAFNILGTGHMGLANNLS